MTSLTVDGLTFMFPAGWIAHKYDEWSFYKNQFGNMRDGIKAIDLLALEDKHTAWFVEVKDYRLHPRTKPSDVSDEVAQKVFDTLAALLPAATNANDASEQGMAREVLKANRIRVVLHLEQPVKHSHLRPRAIDVVAVTQKLKRLLKPSEAHPIVAEKAQMGSIQWSVT